jgi:hypothetical protein
MKSAKITVAIVEKIPAVKTLKSDCHKIFS